MASYHERGELGVAGFSKRVGALPTYPMAELPAIKRKLIEQGVDLIDVRAGDADFPPPDVNEVDALLDQLPLDRRQFGHRVCGEQGVDLIDVGAGDADFPPPDVADEV